MDSDPEKDDIEPNRPSPTTGPVSTDPIGSALRQVYDEVTREPLPDDLAALLDKIKRGDKK